MSVQYWTVGETALAAKVEPSTIVTWIRRGLLPAVRTPGGQYRVHPDDLSLAFGPVRLPPREPGERRGAGGGRP